MANIAASRALEAFNAMATRRINVAGTAFHYFFTNSKNLRIYRMNKIDLSSSINVAFPVSFTGTGKNNPVSEVL
jgi:hypothetical protein